MGLLVFTFSAGGWWVCKLKLMLTQPPTELELELGLSLAKIGPKKMLGSTKDLVKKIVGPKEILYKKKLG